MSAPPDATTPRSSPLLEALGLDLESTLADEPRFLVDARLLGVLHAELDGEFGREEAARVLLQMGFVHGLRDAAQLVHHGLRPGAAPPDRSLISTPRLAMRIAPSEPRAARDAAIVMRGAWPTRHESEAVLGNLGPTDAPTCFASSGYTSGWLSGIFGVDLLVVEQSCTAHGAAGCRFEAREVADWCARREPRAERLLASLPFDALRRLVSHGLAAAPASGVPEEQRDGAFESGAPVVHVWGPVMVIPFSGVDESLRALELIGSDPDAREVRVVVVDLSEAIIDDGFGAVALEQILASIESWGAEPLLAGLSPLSGRVVSQLEHGPFLVEKDLPAAIAKAFQIAEVQRAEL